MYHLTGMISSLSVVSERLDKEKVDFSHMILRGSGFFSKQERIKKLKKQNTTLTKQKKTLKKEQHAFRDLESNKLIGELSKPASSLPRMERYALGLKVRYLGEEMDKLNLIIRDLRKDNKDLREQLNNLPEPQLVKENKILENELK